MSNILALLPLLGRHVSAHVWTLQTLTGATLADSGTTKAMANILTEITLGRTYTMREIVAMDGPRDNNVQISDGQSITVTEIMQQAGANSGPNFLADIGNVGGYWKVTLTRAGKVYTNIFLVGNYREVMVREDCHASVDCVPIDVGSSLPTYA